MSAMTEQILNGDVFQGTDADNATSTVTLAAVPGQRWFLSGIGGDYSAAVAAIKSLTLTYTSKGVAKSIVIRWLQTTNSFHYRLPHPVHGDANTQMTVVLAASGTGGTTGRATAFAFLS